MYVYLGSSASLVQMLAKRHLLITIFRDHSNDAHYEPSEELFKNEHTHMFVNSFYDYADIKQSINNNII